MRRSFVYRLFEMLPATLTWGTFAAITILSFTAPVLVASFMIVYAVYWLARSLRTAVHLVVSYRQLRSGMQVNWLKRLNDNPMTAERWQTITHLVVIATYKEELPILEATFESLLAARFPQKQLLVLLATEERDHDRALRHAAALKKRFGRRFKQLLVTEHPKNIPGEVAGKGSNISYAVRTSLPTLKKMGLDPDAVLVTSLDADNRPHPEYFGALTWAYLTEPERQWQSYQPPPLFFNNIWSVPLAVRLTSIGSSFWQMIEATRPYRLRNFSAQSQSLALLKRTDFWSTETIVEDGHQYWRSLLATNGRHHVVPIFVPIYQDAVLSPAGHWLTYREQYLQKRRWAWGASDVPFVLTEFWKRRRSLPAGIWVQALRLMEGHYSWATTSLVLAFFGWLPSLVHPGFQEAAISVRFASIYHWLLGLAMVGLIVMLVIARLLLPERASRRWLGEGYLAEWLLTPIVLPVTNILFGSLPAIEAQTRLALGKYLGFRVTEKAITRHALPVTIGQSVAKATSSR